MHVETNQNNVHTCRCVEKVYTRTVSGLVQVHVLECGANNRGNQRQTDFKKCVARKHARVGPCNSARSHNENATQAVAS